MSDAADTAPDDAVCALEARLLDAALAIAPSAGWGAGLPAAAARRAGVAPAEAVLLMPEGARDLAALLFARHDRAALTVLAAAPYPQKTTARIRAAVLARVEAAMVDEPAVRRATAYLALPRNAPLAARLLWASADRLWRWAGDTATDQNHYSKRAILSGVLAAVVAAWLAGGRARAERELDAQLARVGAFERWKATLPSADGWLSRAAGALGGLRYGRGGGAPAAPPPRLTYEADAAG